MLRNVVITVFILCLFSTFTYADYDSAKAAFEDGDYETAIKQLLPLATTGEARSQTKLGLMYAKGLGISRNFAEAVKWFRKAAEQGYALGQYNLGVMYAEGLGVPQNFAEAVKWSRKAAEQGYALSQYSLGSMYYDGLGVPQDYTHAYAWISVAGMSGNESAQHDSGRVAREMSPSEVEVAKELARELWEKYGSFQYPATTIAK